eukprot:Tbor_TRINITY_DN4068_c0_g1::TRINITY_DN4068_c0_g1_i1::g.11777::m.11777/K18469/TBC1D5; TBC1 domain family member 5
MWEESNLYKALGSLDLHLRIVTIGLDGSLFYDTKESVIRGSPGNHSKYKLDSTSPHLSSPVCDNKHRRAYSETFLSKATISSPSLGYVEGEIESSPPLRSSYQPTIFHDRVSNMPDDHGGSNARDFEEGNTHILRCNGVNNMMSKFFTRSVLWRIYLRILPFPYTGTSIETIIEEWPTKLYTSRAWYSCKKQELLVCYPSLKYVDEDCALMERPLNTFSTLYGDAKDDRGNRYKTHESVKKSHLQNNRRVDQSPLDTGPDIVRDDIITLDIRRTYVHADSEVPHHMLYMILSMWRWLNPVVGYQQGMHELVGNVVIMLNRASQSIPKNTPQGVAECCNAAFIEADAYHIFDAMMNELGLIELFASSSTISHTPQVSYNQSSCHILSPDRGKKDDENDNSEKNTSQINNLSSEFASPVSPICNLNETAANMNTLGDLCHNIVFEMLKDHSSSLFNHFACTHMLDQLLLFLPRWVRNLFTRELSRSQVFVVWDGIFAVYYHDIVSSRLERVKGIYALTASKDLATLESPFSWGSFYGRCMNRMLGMEAKDDPQPTTNPELLLNSCTPTDVKYAGQNDTMRCKYMNVFGSESVNDSSASSELPSGILKGAERSVCGLRTIAGVAVELLLYIQDDLLEAPEDFSQLKRLTSTPLVPADTDAVGLMCRATKIARTRPMGIVLMNSGVLTSHEEFGSSGEAMHHTTHQSACGSSRYKHRGVSSGRLTREELLEQQKSVSVVISNVSERIRLCLPPLFETENELSDKSNGPGGKAFSASSHSSGAVSITEDALKTLHVCVLELGYLAEKLT